MPKVAGNAARLAVSFNIRFNILQRIEEMGENHRLLPGTDNSNGTMPKMSSVFASGCEERDICPIQKSRIYPLLNP